MIGFKLDANGDLSLNSDKKWPLLQTYQEAVKQRLQIKLRTFKGEWFLDVTYGIPYRDTGDGKAIIGKGYSKKEIDALYLSEIAKDPDVLAIRSFSSTYNPINRQYDLDFEVKAREGDLRVDVPSLYPWEEITYTYNDAVFKTSCKVALTTWAERLHPIVHNDLPAGGQYTWVSTGDYVVSGYADVGYFGTSKY